MSEPQFWQQPPPWARSCSDSFSINEAPRWRRPQCRPPILCWCPALQVSACMKWQEDWWPHEGQHWPMGPLQSDSVYLRGPGWTEALRTQEEGEGSSKYSSGRNHRLDSQGLPSTRERSWYATSTCHQSEMLAKIYLLLYKALCIIWKGCCHPFPRPF